MHIYTCVYIYAHVFRGIYAWNIYMCIYIPYTRNDRPSALGALVQIPDTPWGLFTCSRPPGFAGDISFHENSQVGACFHIK